MKKILIIAVLLMLLLAVFISCGRGNAKTTVVYTPETFPDDYVNGDYAPVGGHNYYDGGYNFKSKVEYSDRKCSNRTIEIFGKTYKLDYNETIKPQFAVNSIDFYIAYNSDGKKANVKIGYHSGTDQIVSVRTYGLTQTNLDEAKNGLLKIEDDFITYAKELVSDYLKFSEYETYVENSDDIVLVYFYKLLDGYKTEEWVRVLIHKDGTLKGIDSHNIGSYDSFKNAKFNKQAIELYAAGKKIESITIINDDGDLVAKIKYWVTRHVATTTPADGSPHPTETVLLTRYVPLTKQSSASKVTTARATTAAQPIVTTPRTTELIFTTAPAEPILKPQG